MRPAADMLELRGIPVSGGSRVGRALLYEEDPDVRVVHTEPPDDPEAEIARLADAVGDARGGLESLRDSLKDQSEGVAEIFGAHAAMLTDFVPRVEAVIRAGTSAEHAVAQVFHEYAARLEQVADPLLAQRAQDVVDLERRLLRALHGVEPAARPRGPGDGPVVVIARTLTPSETAGLQGHEVAAIALELGGPTSHTALIAKSLGIPCVVGVEDLLAHVRPGETVWVDGSKGTVVLQPDPRTIRRAKGLGARYDRLEAALLGESHLPAETIDGHRATLLANVEFKPDVEAGMARGAEGVGLYRTEFLIDENGRLPTEEEQLAAYRWTLETIGHRRLTIRTFDFGADKPELVERKLEPNAALGERSLRWCFANPALFHVQLRALLRVAAEGDVRIMLPMVGSLEEVRLARAAIARAARELATEGLPHEPSPPLGVMIEVPAAAVTADVLASEVDFFSIGTNDLIQYGLAVDRLNPQVAHLFKPSHPSLLRMLETTLRAARAAGIPVTMCGEMGGHSIYTVLLFGMGLRAFSLTPGYIPRARRLLRGLTLREARMLAAECLRLSTADEVEALLQARVTPVGSG